MRLIDGDYLYNKLVANKCPYDLVLQMVKDEPTVDVLDKIRQEIEQIVDEEIKHDEKWAIGLRYAVKIIDKYRGKE